MLVAKAIPRGALLSFLLVLSCKDSPTETRKTPTPAALDIVAGDGQTGVVGTELANPLVVRVEDASGQPVPGQLVNFRVTAGGGSVFAGSGLTNAFGIVQDRWTLGTSTADSQRVEARAVDPNTGARIVFATFRATPMPGPAHSVTKAAGDAQTGALGAALGDSLAVRVADSFGNPVPGVIVAWATSAGNGAVSPAASQTNAQGMAKTRWTLGARLDVPHSVTATAGTLPPATFGVTATVPSTATMVKVAGDGASAPVGTEAPESLAVRVQLADGHVVAGVQVSWTVSGGGGSIAPDAPVTQADGIARTRLTLGNAAGPTVIVASVTGLTPVQFTVTATPGPPASLTKISGDGQQGTAGQPLAQPIVVRLTDQFSNVISGVTVGWQVFSGGGSVTASSSATDATGNTSVGWTLGSTAGVNQVTASVPGLASVTFLAHGAAGSPSGLTIISGNAQTAAVGMTLPQALVVRLSDALGNTIANASVSFSVTSGGGSVTPSAVTDANGEARATWSLGGVVGTQTVSASAGGASASFSAVATIGAAATIAKVSGDAQTGTIGQSLAQPLVVRVQDRFGNDVPGATVTWTVLSGGGSTSPPNGQTNVSGQASTQWTLGPAGGTHGLRAQVTDDLSVTFSASALVPGGSALLIQSGDGQWGRVATELPIPLAVRLVNSAGQPIAGVAVTWVPSKGTATPTSSTTDANGAASTRWTLGTSVETATLIASATGANSATFTATVRPGPLCQLGLSGNGQTGVINRPLAQPLRLIASDRYGNPTGPASINPGNVPGNSSGFLSGTLQTDSNGVSPPVIWTLGSTVGTQYKTFSWIPGDSYCTGGGVLRAEIGATGILPTAVSVTVSPDSARVRVGDTAPFTASVRDATGVEIGGATWSSLDGAIATVDETGVARAVGPGRARIVATAGAAADTAWVIIGSAITVNPPSALLATADTLTFRATVYGESGQVIPGAFVSWSSTNSAAVEVDAGGRARAIAPGDAVIEATYQGLRGSASVRVVANVARVGMVEAGGNFTCALLTSGSAFCWGQNADGQLGDGTTTPRPVPTPVVGGFSFSQIATGPWHTCGLRSDGVALCWGNNSNGSLGDGSTSNRLTPTVVRGGLTFDMITARDHTCGLASGRAYCWGPNHFGQLGVGDTTARYEPTPVLTTLSFTAIAAASGTTCALTTTAALYCWGSNNGGQVGDGTTTNRWTPVQVAPEIAFGSVAAAGGSSMCGLTNDARAYCWGWNHRGQLGDGTTTNRLTPTEVSGGLQFGRIEVGGNVTCAVSTEEAAYCWGVNLNGMLGDGTTTDRWTPTAVTGGRQFRLVSPGAVGGHTCGTTTRNEAYCWGDNWSGQLGIGTAGGRSTVPVLVAFPNE